LVKSTLTIARLRALTLLGSSMAKAKPSPVPSKPAPLLSGFDPKAAGLVLLACFLAYLPSFQGIFIWNDADYVTAPELRSASGLWAIWTRLGATEQYYPLLHSFFWFQHLVWGDNPFGYHLVTLLLHVSGAILFALTLKRLEIPGAWLAALIFALHPVHVESVAWITEQKNTLSLVFYLLSAWMYLQYTENNRSRTYWFAFAWFVLSLLCKTVTASLPAALLVALWWKHGKLTLKDWKPLLPWLITGAVVGLFTSWVEQHYLGAKGQDFSLPFLERGLVAGRAIWFYLGNLIWPFDLNFLYPRWVPDHRVGWQWLYPAGVFALLGLLWALRRRSRAPLAAFLFFIGSLFPVLGFVNLYGALYSFVWDHWQYLPDLGLIALAAAGLSLAVDRLGSAWRPAFATGLALGLGALTWAHCAMFHDDRTLYRETLARNPDAWMAHFNLGCLLATTPGQEQAAIAEFQATLRLKPDHAGAHTNLAKTLMAIPGREQEGMAHYEEALRLSPNNGEAEYNFAVELSRVPGRETDAVAHYEAALRLLPKVGEIHYNLGNVLLKIPGRQADAIAQYREAVQLKPDLAEAHYNLALALAKDPQLVPEAITHFQAALDLKPADFPLARQVIQRWNASQGKL
jgi:tetratricopeptide (TPR) repeat protein